MEEQEAMMADHQDYLFYSRVVGGIQKQQEKIKDAKLRYQNQALLDHMKYIRSCQTPPRTTSTAPKMPSINSELSRLSQKGVLLAVHKTLSIVDAKDMRNEEESLIFEIDI
jgi:hypothetical protein